MAWRDAGFAAEEARRWGACLMVSEAEDAVAWRDAGFTPEEATAWCDSDVIEVAEAIEWRNAGFTAEQAKAWCECEMVGEAHDAVAWRTAGFTAAEAAQWCHAWLFSPGQAAALRSRGLTPQAAASVAAGAVALPADAQSDSADLESAAARFIVSIGYVLGALVALVGVFYDIWFIYGAFAGGKVPFTSWHVTGNITFGLVWLLLGDIVVLTICYWIALVIATPFILLAGGTETARQHHAKHRTRFRSS